MSEYDNLSNEMGGKCSTKPKRCQGYRYSVLVYLAVIVEKHPERMKDLLGYQALLVPFDGIASFGGHASLNWAWHASVSYLWHVYHEFV